MKALAIAARTALPTADVPIDFTDRVMDAIVEPADDGALADAVRSRKGLLIFLPTLVAAVIAVVMFWPRPEPRGLDPFHSVKLNGATVTALEPCLLSGRMLSAGSAVCESGEGTEVTTIETPLGNVSLPRGSRAIIRLSTSKEQSEMNLKQLRSITPAFLAVTVLAGSATVSCAQGGEHVRENEVVEVHAGKAPVLNADAVVRELRRMQASMLRLQARMEALAARVERTRANTQRKWPDLLEESDIPSDIPDEEIIEEPIEPRDPRTAEMAKLWARLAYDEKMIEQRVREMREIEQRLDQGMSFDRYRALVAAMSAAVKYQYDEAGVETLLEQAKAGDAKATQLLGAYMKEIQAALARANDPRGFHEEVKRIRAYGLDVTSFAEEVERLERKGRKGSIDDVAAYERELKDANRWVAMAQALAYMRKNAALSDKPDVVAKRIHELEAELSRVAADIVLRDLVDSRRKNEAAQTEKRRRAMRDALDEDERRLLKLKIAELEAQLAVRREAAARAEAARAAAEKAARGK